MEKEKTKKTRDSKEPWVIRPAIYIIGTLTISFFLIRDFVLPILYSPNPKEYVSSLKLEDRLMILVSLLLLSNFLRLLIRGPKTKVTITLKDLKEKLSSKAFLPDFLIENWLLGFKNEGFKRDFSHNLMAGYLFIISFVLILGFGGDKGIKEKLLSLFLFVAFLYSQLRIFIWVILPGRMWRRKVILVINRMARLRKTHKFDILGEVKAEDIQQQLEPSNILKEMYSKAWGAFEAATILAACRNQYTNLYTLYSKALGIKNPEPFQASYFYFISLFLALEQKISELDVALKLDKMSEKIRRSWRENMQPSDFGSVSAKSAFDVAISFAKEVNELVKYGVKYGHKESRIDSDEYASVRVKPAEERVQTWVEDSLVWIDNDLPSRRSWPTKKVLKDYDMIINRMDEEAYRTLNEKKGLESQGLAKTGAIETGFNQQHDLETFVTSAKAVTKTSSFQEWAGDKRVTLAIVFTDVVGSTALGEEIRDEAMNEVRQAHFAQSRKLIDQLNAREIKTIGDSFMTAFKNVNAALDYAIALQQNTGHPRVQIRAGIHIGPMQVEEGDVFGCTVNFAARVIGAIKGTEIWLSNLAKEDIDRLGAAQHKHLKWERHEGVAMKGFPGVFTLWSLKK